MYIYMYIYIYLSYSSYDTWVKVLIGPSLGAPKEG